ncbi:hypothetical protein HKX48_001128 [Thoreauomyces humboldtii]|nr:hypothetical protein HKX48_001128 [Thoreauomyces humboldtii]
MATSTSTSAAAAASTSWKPSADAVHVLKKDLIVRQLRLELSVLLECDNFATALLQDQAAQPSRFPLLAPLFTRLCVPFPPLKVADDGPVGAWTVFGSFFGHLLRVDSGGTTLHMAKRDLVANKVLEVLGAMLGKSIRTTTESEATAATSLSTQSHPQNVPAHGDAPVQLSALHVFESVTVTSSQIVTKSGFFKTTESVEFVLESSLNGRVRTAHRDYSSFKTLHKEMVRRKNVSVPALPVVQPTASRDGGVDGATLAALSRYVQQLSVSPTSTMRDFLNQSEPLAPVASEDGSEQKAHAIEDALARLRDDLVAPGGMGRIFAVVGQAEEVAELPPHYQKSIEWWKICMAATLYRTFVADDRAPEHKRRLKNFHSRAPYRSWAALLKGTNAVLVVKAIGNLLLARPFGGKCLLQSALTSTLDDEIRATNKELDYVQSFLTKDPGCIPRAKALVQNSPAAGYAEERTRQLPNEVLGAELPQGHPDRLAAEKLLELLWQQRRLYQLRALVAEDIVIDLAKTVLSVSYKPLAEAYKATDPGSFIRDGSKFVDDLIKVVDAETAKDASAPSTSPGSAPLQPFLTLLARHEQRIFKHVHSTISTNPHKVEALTDIAAWVDDLARFFNGVGPVVDLVAVVNNCKGVDSARLDADIDKLVQRKAAREEKRWARILDRVRGYAGRNALEEELDGPAHETLKMQGLWETSSDMSSVAGIPLGDESDGSLQPPRLADARSFASFESLGDGMAEASGDSTPQNHTPGVLDVPADATHSPSYGGSGLSPSKTAVSSSAHPLDEEEQVEAQLRSMFLIEQEQEAAANAGAGPHIEVSDPSDAPLAEDPWSAPGSPVRDSAQRRTVWKDPADCAATPTLVGPWLAALGPWLAEVAQ